MNRCQLCEKIIRRWQCGEWMGGRWYHKRCINRQFRSLYRRWETGKAAERNYRDRD